MNPIPNAPTMTVAAPAPELFLSYRRTQASAVAPWVQALRAAGIGVWQDSREIEALDDFSAEIAAALSRAKALLVWYSVDYTESIPCQWELTAAFIAAQREGQPMRRIFVVNPEPSADHIVLPAELTNSHYLAPTAGGEADFVAAIRHQLAGIQQAFGAVRPETPPDWWPHQPPAAPRFTGRQRDLWKLQSLLLKGSDSTVTAAAPAGRVCIRGLGGMGKTLLSQQYALRFGWTWPGGVYWFDGRGGNRVAGDGYSLRSELETQFAALARNFGFHTEGMDADFMRGLVRQKLGEHQRPYLWIIDDVPPGVPLAELSAWSAPTANGKTLVSTRSTQYRLVDGELELLGLSAPAGLALLGSRRPPADEAETCAASEIIQRLGGHALAIEIAAAAVEGSFAAAPYAEFLAALSDAVDDALEPDPHSLDQLPTGHDHSVVRTLLGSIKLVGEAAQQVLLLASRIAEAPIPFDLIVRVLGDETRPTRILESAVKVLEAHALAQRDTRARTVQIHPIVNYVVRRWRDQAAAAIALRPFIADALNEMLGDVEDARRYAEITLLLAHARDLTSSSAVESLPATLWLTLSRYELAIANYPAAEHAALAVWKPAPASANAASRDTVQALILLADIRYAQGRFAEAAVFGRQAIDMGSTYLGSEDRDSLTAMNIFANTLLMAQDDLDGALKLHESALAIRRRVLGEEDPDTLISMGNLASTLCAQNDLAGALKLQKSALAIQRRVLGEEHPHTLTAMNNLANTLYAWGDLAGALELETSVLATRRHVLGEEHPDTIGSAWNLFTTAHQLPDRPLGQELLRNWLFPLLTTNPSNLGADLKNIRQQLLDHRADIEQFTGLSFPDPPATP